MPKIMRRKQRGSGGGAGPGDRRAKPVSSEAVEDAGFRVAILPRLESRHSVEQSTVDGDEPGYEAKRDACLAAGDGHFEYAWTHEFPGMGVLAMEPLRSLSTGNELAQGYNSEIAALTVEINKREAEIEALLK